MATVRVSQSPGARVKAGAAVLAAAASVDTRLISSWLAAFTKAHRAYAAAHDKAAAAEADLAAAAEQLDRRDAAQDEAVEALACALVAGGRARTAPFAAFNSPTPAALKNLAPLDAAKAIQQLVAAVQRNGASTAVARAAQAADKAALAVEGAATAVEKTKRGAADKRSARDALAPVWDNGFAALKRAARAAEGAGAPQLYSALFDHLARPVKHAKPAPPPPQPTPNPPADPAA